MLFSRARDPVFNERSSMRIAFHSFSWRSFLPSRGSRPGQRGALPSEFPRRGGRRPGIPSGSCLSEEGFSGSWFRGSWRFFCGADLSSAPAMVFFFRIARAAFES